MLDGRETELEIIDHPSSEISVESLCSTYNPDVYVVVYSVVDRKSMKVAEDILMYLWKSDYMSTKGVILVGNKADLERKREVATSAGRKLANNCGCKFIETSSGLDHNVDELLVGILAQVQLNPKRRRQRISKKKELHAHLNGSLSPSTLKELFEYHRQNEFEKVNSVDTSIFNKESYSLNEFFQLFKVMYILTATPESVQIATERVIEDFCKENVIYLELRSTLRKEDNMTKRDYIESVIQGILRCRKKFPNISVKLIVSINRGETIESATQNVNIAIEYSKKYPDIIIGIDTSGNPEKSKFCDYVKLLKRARSEGLKFTIHCAEVPGSEEVKDILDFNPERIGHGTCIHELLGGSQVIWDELLMKKIPVELCISSNIKCKTVESYDRHHFKLLYNANHPITIATDDKGIFRSTLSDEYEIVQKEFNLNEKELWTLSYQSINYTFTDENEKEQLRTILNQWQIGNI
ncbi:hypothetical protein RUM43_014619 [Polyplax serrata]|uniref:Adenosine deaminase-like protein n=1 Tax=Polyplax serrata TaxID=468196 RepID=A0AAN8NWS2_POLSC